MDSQNFFEIYSNLESKDEFKSLKSVKEIVKYILDYVKPLHTFRDEVFQKADNYCANHKKSTEKSRELRAKAQKCIVSDCDSARNYFTEVCINTRLNLRYSKSQLMLIKILVVVNTVSPLYSETYL